MENLKEQIKLLIELQGLDTHIFRFEDELESIPETIKKKEEEFKEKNSSLKKLEDDLKALVMKRKEREGDLEAKEGSIRKYQQQLNQVKTNKEYSALQEEIGRVKADNSIIEEAILNLFDEIDAGNKKIAKEKDFLKSEEAAFNEEKKKLIEESNRIKTELEGLKKQRAELTAKVDKNILKKYERIIKNKDGLAVVTIADEACQGCFRVMPPQVVNEIKMNDELVFCENCARILYLDE
jgi:hypothetical protein